MSSRVVLATIVLVAMLIGGNFTSLKFALDHTTPFLLAGMRTVIGGSALLAFARFRGERFPRRIDDLARILVVSLSITTVSSGLLVYGVNRVPAGVASLVASTMPLFTALLALLLMGTAISGLGRIGLAVGFAGTVVLALPSLEGEAAAIGIGSLVLSAIAWAFGTVYMKWKDFSRVSPIMLVGVQLIMSALVLIPFALAVEGSARTDWSVGLAVPLLYSAIPANAVTFSLLATVVRRATPTQAAASAYLVPVFGVLFGWLIRSEKLGLVELTGGVLVVAGVYLLVTATARHTGSMNDHSATETAAESAANDEYHLAQFNVARAKGPTDGPAMAEFMANLDRINGLADDSPGFVWRFQTEDGDATSVRAFDDPDMLLNYSIWEDYESFHHYVYKTDHVNYMRRRKEWFEPVKGLPVTVLWWVPAGTVPTIDDAIARLHLLAERGPSPDAFNFRTRFDPPNNSAEAEATATTGAPTPPR